MSLHGADQGTSVERTRRKSVVGVTLGISSKPPGDNVWVICDQHTLVVAARLGSGATYVAPVNIVQNGSDRDVNDTSEGVYPGVLLRGVDRGVTQQNISINQPF